MKARAFFVVAAVGVAVVTTVLAQPQPVASAPYVVKHGDNLWNLAKVRLQDPRKWERLVELNPFLKAPGRVFTKDDGTDVVLIKPGEMLEGLTELGIALTPLPDFNLRPAPTPVASAPAPAVSNSSTEQWWGVWLLPWVLLALGLWALFLKRKMEPAPSTQVAVNNDPATAGPPMVPGGTTDANADEALRSVAARQFDGRVQDFTVLNRTPGRVYGQMVVLYADRTQKTWQLSGQQAWRAQVRFPNGHEETVYMLQACGNDLRFGGVERYHPSSGFRFIEDTAAAQPAPDVEAPVAHPTVAAAETDTVPPGTVKVEIKAAEEEGRPAMVRVHGINPVVGASFELSENGFILRYAQASATPSKSPSA